MLKKYLDEETILYSGSFFEIVSKQLEFTTETGTKIINVEIVKRPPGVRVITVTDKKMLLIKEYRAESNSWDYRLPGGKVFDFLKPYKDCIKEDDLESKIKQAVYKEMKEETGIIVNNPILYCKTLAGASIVWDLYYFVVKSFDLAKTDFRLEAGEFIENTWKTFEEVRALCLDGSIQEDRTIGVLLRFVDPIVYGNALRRTLK